MKIITIIAFIIISHNVSFAISVKDIVPIYVSSYTIDNLLDRIKYSVEPYASNWTKEWRHPVSRESVAQEIKEMIDELDSRVWAEDLWVISFTKALLWHYYYQLENEIGYFASDSICKIIKKEFPQRYESFWLDGINKIKAGRVAEGFAILDSLYIFASVSSSFINEYSQMSRECFIPQSSGDNNNIKRDEFYFSPKELKPVLSLWESDENDGVVSFIFTERYSFVENFQLKYPKLYNDGEYKFNMDIDERFMTKIKFPLLWDPSRAALHPATYKITVDRKKQKKSLFDYILSIVYKRFDFISEIKPPYRKNGISVRAGQYNVIRGVSGQSIIYTLYDHETYGNIERFFTTPNTLKDVKPMDTRILVSLETTQRAEPKAIDFYLNLVNGNINQ